MKRTEKETKKDIARMKTGSDNEELTSPLVGGNCLSAQAATATVRSSPVVRSGGQRPQLL